MENTFSTIAFPGEQPLLIYSSSAGSGKTYTLTREYLSLALLDPTYFRNILAVTFTNKATAEMKSRILENLHQLSRGDASMGIALSESLGLTEAELMEKARLCLAEILHQYDYFQVSTIDSFFQRIIQSFSREIGLQGGFSIEMNTGKVLDTIVDQLVDEAGADDLLTDWLVDFAFQKIQEGKGWDFRKEIKGLASQLLQEDFLQQKEQMLSLIQRKAEGKDDKVFLKKIIDDFERQLIALGKKGLEILSQNGVSISDFSHKENGAAGVFYKVGHKNFEIIKKSSRFQNGLISEDIWVAKSFRPIKKRERLLQIAAQQLMPLAVEMDAFYDQNIRIYNTADQILKNWSAFGLLSYLERKLQDYRKEEEVILISDSSALIKEIIQENDSPFIYEKVGNVYRHYLIDEFQDTSRLQWENFKPLIENSLAEGRRNLLVGDVKQSIYRFRGGDSDIMLRQVQKEIGEERIQFENLNTNWRSLEEVIRFNNEVFSQLPVQLSDSFTNEGGEVHPFSNFISHSFQEVEQEPARKGSADWQGYVNVVSINCENAEESYPDALKHLIPQQLRELQDQGYALKDIAILVGRKTEGEWIADLLLACQEKNKEDKYQYTFISSEVLYIQNALSVQTLLSALHYLHDPEDEINTYNLHYSLKLLTEKSYADLEGKGFSWQNLYPDFIEKMKQAQGEKSLFEKCSYLVESFAMQKASGEWPYLQAFLEEVHRFEKQNARAIDYLAFQQWWEEEGSNKSLPIPEHNEGIKIMTIHKSKGLQFGVVLLPFLKMSIHPKVNSLLWGKTDQGPFDELGLVPVLINERLEQSFFAEEYNEEKIKTASDTLNKLYVACTRPEEQLIVYLNEKADKIEIGKVLFNGLKPRIEEKGKELEDPYLSSLSIEAKSLEWGAPPSAPKKSRIEKLELDHSLSHFHQNDWKQKLKVRYSFDPDALNLEKNSPEQLQHGICVHQLFAHLQSPEDLDFAIKKCHAEGLIKEEKMAFYRDYVQKCLELPPLKEGFSGGWEVRSEESLMEENGELRRIDKAFIKDGKVILVDFKTGSFHQGHSFQLGNYVEILKQMGYQIQGAYLLYTDELKVVSLR